jgi:hypothetical protein
MKLTNGNGARLICDPIGGEVTFECGRAAAKNGIIFIYQNCYPAD